MVKEIKNIDLFLKAVKDKSIVKKPDAGLNASGFFYFTVVWGGIEPPTQGFSVLENMD